MKVILNRFGKFNALFLGWSTGHAQYLCKPKLWSKLLVSKVPIFISLVFRFTGLIKYLLSIIYWYLDFFCPNQNLAIHLFILIYSSLLFCFHYFIFLCWRPSRLRACIRLSNLTQATDPPTPLSLPLPPFLYHSLFFFFYFISFAHVLLHVPFFIPLFMSSLRILYSTT